MWFASRYPQSCRPGSRRGFRSRGRERAAALPTPLFAGGSRKDQGEDWPVNSSRQTPGDVVRTTMRLEKRQTQREFVGRSRTAVRKCVRFGRTRRLIF